MITKRKFICGLLLLCLFSGSAVAQSEAQQKHPKFPQLMEHVKIALAAKKKGDYRTATSEMEAGLKIAIEIAGENDAMVSALHTGAGNAWQEQGNYDKALEHYLKGLAIDLKIFGENHPDLSTAYNNIGLAHRKKGSYDKALEFYEKALSVIRKAHGENHQNMETIYNNIGAVWDEKGDYDKALSYYQKSIDIGVKARGDKDPGLANSYNNMGAVLKNKGDFARALQYYDKALQLDIKNYGENHPEVARRYHNIGSALGSKGEYDKAAEYHAKALRIGLKTLGEVHPDVATYYSSLGNDAAQVHNYAKAEEYHQKALAIEQKVYGENHPDLAIRYGNLGSIATATGNHDKAIEYFEKALQIGMKAYGEFHPRNSTRYNNLAGAWEKKGDRAKAIEYYEKALKIAQKTLGAKHPDVAIKYSNLALTLQNQGDFDKAIEYSKAALSIWEAGQDRHGYLVGMSNLGEIYNKAKRYPEASAIYAQLIRQLLRYRFELSGEKSSFTARYAHYFFRAMIIELMQKNFEKMFEYDSLRRGLSLAEALSLKDALAQGGVSPAEQKQMLDLASEIESLRARHAAAASRGKAEDSEELLQRVFSKEKQKDELDQKLSERYPRYSEIRFPKAPTVASVQQKLADDEIFVGYLIHQEMTIAFVIHKQDGLNVMLLSGGKGSDNGIYRGAGIRQSITNFHALHTGHAEANIVPIQGKTGMVYWNTGAQPGKYDMDKEGNILALLPGGSSRGSRSQGQFEKVRIGKANEAFTSKQIMEEREGLRKALFSIFVDPVRKRYPRSRSWVISPDGALYYLPFSLLAGKDVKMPEVTLVHSAVVWQKLRGSERKATPQALLAFGNPVYGAGHSDSRGATRGARRAPTKQSAEKLSKLRVSLTRDTSELTWENLDGTAIEVKNIAALAYADRQKEMAQHVHTGVAANVDRILALRAQNKIGDYQYIHFAVHGLFVDGNPALNALVLTLPEKAKEHKRAEYDAYVKAQPLSSDGYLRAGDISSLNLNAELVVMSACETSLGHEVGGEGMVALPQSFLTAGARSVVASLWSVDDAATSLFMQRFYQYLLKDKQRPKQALAMTQRDFRELAEFSAYRDPFYWAAFVIYGE